MCWFSKFISKSQDQITLNHNGVEFEFTFENEPVVFDPIDLLLEIEKTYPNSKTHILPEFVSCSNEILGLPSREYELLPAATCTIDSVTHFIKVNLFKYFESSYPVSEFVFSVNGIESGSLCMIYDSGATARKYACRINSDFIEEDIFETSWKWICPSTEWILIQKSTNTSIWKWNSSFQSLTNLTSELRSSKSSSKSKFLYAQKNDLGQFNNFS